MTAASTPPADSLALVTVIYGGALTLWMLASTVRGTPLVPLQQAAGTVFGLAAAALGITYLADLARGHASPEPWLTVGYAVAAMLLLPAAWPKREMAPRMAAGSALLASLSVSVVVARLRVTW